MVRSSEGSCCYQCLRGSYILNVIIVDVKLNLFGLIARMWENTTADIKRCESQKNISRGEKSRMRAFNLVQSMMVLSLCAIVKTVQSSNCVRIVDWIRSSVSRSMAAVASSRIRILVFLRRARAKQTSCLWPTLSNEKFLPFLFKYDLLNLRGKTEYCSSSVYLRFSPPSVHVRSSLEGWLLTNFFK